MFVTVTKLWQKWCKETCTLAHGFRKNLFYRDGKGVSASADKRLVQWYWLRGREKTRTGGEYDLDDPFYSSLFSSQAFSLCEDSIAIKIACY